MRRLLPAPLLSLALFALWLVLNQHAGINTLATAAVLAIAIPLLTAPLRPLAPRSGRPLVALALLRTVLVDAIASNLEIARSIWRPDRAPRAMFVQVPLELRDANGLAVLAIVTTIIPGTVWCELALDRSSLLLHVFDVEDSGAFIDRYKRRYEQPLIAIFESNHPPRGFE
ncbi:MAG TPA: Na+/H+ antiporter subunit E [Casimicrobiaceae bacterium]|nr:Na+/H+ antiporter subunit E [Casimicrobiaceae bacterium]